VTTTPRMSHRARGLLLLGAVWVLVGFSVLNGGSDVPDDAYPLAWFSPEVTSVMWLVSGSIAISAALLAAANPATRWVFIGLLLPACLRMLSYAWATGLSVLTDYGQESAWLSATVWGVVIVFVLHEASVPEIPHALIEHDRDDLP
jgi:hypothetical protein